MVDAPERRPSKAIKDLGDIARLIEAHPQLAALLLADVSRALMSMTASAAK